MPFSLDEIFAPFSDILSEKLLAVAVSGGPDSMALAVMLSEWLAGRKWGGALHALSVDHGLRPESAAEVRGAGEWLCAHYPGMQHRVLLWRGDKPQARVQEEARAARYDLMKKYCRSQEIGFLFLAHHQDDQAETFLMRLAAGSGLDGLSGMAARQALGDDGRLAALRPLLAVPKTALVTFCRERGIPYADDPSNHMHKFIRARLRGSAEILEREGLSAKRLSLTARRLARARGMLEAETEKFISASLKNKETNRFVFCCSMWSDAYEELVFRAVRKIIKILGAGEDDVSGYGPRTERVEALAVDILKSEPFRKRTLGGVEMWIDTRKDEIIFRKETVKKR